MKTRSTAGEEKNQKKSKVLVSHNRERITTADRRIAEVQVVFIAQEKSYATWTCKKTRIGWTERPTRKE
jgi:hypothetical protein